MLDGARCRAAHAATRGTWGRGQEDAMTTPHVPRAEEAGRTSTYTPPSAPDLARPAEPEVRVYAWPTQADEGSDAAPLRGDERHIPHGLRDVGPVGWVGLALMALVLALVVFGLVLPWLGVRESYVWNPLR
jgi:hypothetical protein